MEYRSRWGWHPCDYETYCLLKGLSARCWAARRRFAEWQRWQRKQPQNRVIRATVRDEQGRRVGRIVVGPRPEPALDPLFCTRVKVVRHWSADGRRLRDGMTVERIAFDDRGIPAAYRAARRPASAEGKVAELGLTPEAIRQFAAQPKEVSQPAT